MSVGGRNVIAIDRSASSKCCCLDGRNWRVTVFRRQNPRFRKRFSKIGLSYNVAVPRYNTVCKFGANWYKNGRKIRQTLPQQQQPAVCSNFAFGRCGTECVSELMGLVTLTFDPETSMRVACKMGNLHSKFGHARPSRCRVCMQRTDRQTDKSNAYCPLPHMWGHNDLLHWETCSRYYAVKQLNLNWTE